MIEVDIPGFRNLKLDHLVLDYDGTLARDGVMLEDVPDRLAALSTNLRIHIITANTFGKAQDELAGIPADLLVLPEKDQAKRKLRYASALGMNSCVGIGNGRNDWLMLSEAVLGIAVIHSEGTATEAWTNADIICTSIADALDLLLYPRRLVATLRS